MWWSELRAGWEATIQGSDSAALNFGVLMASPCVYSPSTPETFHRCTVLYKQQYADSLLYGSCWIFHQIAIFRVGLHICSVSWRSGRGNGEWTNGRRESQTGQKADAVKDEKRCKRSAPSSPAAASPASLLCLLPAACWGPILVSTVSSQCWFCLIGWFATSLLIDNCRREIVISPSAEQCS